ncbi:MULTISPECIES: YdeI/OmpD-associated family protein [unclassified Corallococcus]|uniref:YdeI/OmpD-associated family protein n=1 Tax=unclassified Corallococcus TaxID=2685029 RepID=UPI001A8E1750|nr:MULTISPECIES: YdeI/OmpD-associated family protein [unclassified Corallococcus]MBN9684421.1 YdeI/OmpD-associated family protein [Corallococcus sp. NCSPR001]WAS84102.1 YdeI/OmpD-associated family protein [Corallococcus sp. NCRR]
MNPARGAGQGKVSDRMKAKQELPVVPFASEKAWEKWLEKHHADSPGVWVKLAKLESGIPSVTYAQALEVALCYGWIDGQKDAFDSEYWLQRFTPRKPRSRWSKINCGKVEALVASGRMKPAGLREVESARADGRWEAAYAGAKTIEVPEDLTLALEKNPKAKAFFTTLKSANRYAILFRLHDAKKPETRARRLEKFVAMLEAGETLHG